jgi:hypothetical protein
MEAEFMSSRHSSQTSGKAISEEKEEGLVDVPTGEMDEVG